MLHVAHLSQARNEKEIVFDDLSSNMVRKGQYSNYMGQSGVPSTQCQAKCVRILLIASPGKGSLLLDSTTNGHFVNFRVDL